MKIILARFLNLPIKRKNNRNILQKNFQNENNSRIHLVLQLFVVIIMQIKAIKIIKIKTIMTFLMNMFLKKLKKFKKHKRHKASMKKCKYISISSTIIKNLCNNLTTNIIRIMMHGRIGQFLLKNHQDKNKNKNSNWKASNKMKMIRILISTYRA